MLKVFLGVQEDEEEDAQVCSQVYILEILKNYFHFPTGDQCTCTFIFPSSVSHLWRDGPESCRFRRGTGWPCRAHRDRGHKHTRQVLQKQKAQPFAS